MKISDIQYLIDNYPKWKAEDSYISFLRKYISFDSQEIVDLKAFLASLKGLAPDTEIVGDNLTKLVTLMTKYEDTLSRPASIGAPQTTTYRVYDKLFDLFKKDLIKRNLDLIGRDNLRNLLLNSRGNIKRLNADDNEITLLFKHERNKLLLTLCKAAKEGDKESLKLLSIALITGQYAATNINDILSKAESALFAENETVQIDDIAFTKIKTKPFFGIFSQNSDQIYCIADIDTDYACLSIDLAVSQMAIPIDPTEAVSWLKVAREYKHPDTAFTLAKFYAGSQASSEVNHDKTTEYLKYSADSGNKEAQKILDGLVAFYQYKPLNTQDNNTPSN